MARQLKVLDELESILDEEGSKKPPLPTKAECLYVEPLPSGERKNCKNCALWVVSARCLIHDPTLHIAEDAVCGYWVGGRPLDSDFHLDIKQYIPPGLTGLTRAKDGTSCDNCRWYKAQSDSKGHCFVLHDGGSPAAVQPRGCCSHWQGG